MMTFNELKEFISSKMRLSHIYQPLLIKSLIDAGGTATIRQMAISFLSQDESQIIYYEKRLKNMPVRVLSKHGVIKLEGDLITLQTNKLSFKQKAELKRICEEKLQKFIEKRGLSLWDYRFLDSEPVRDSLRFRVIKEAKGRCALCGATKTVRPLDVDHIIPRSKGGKTEYENLQVLCSKCNRTKGNKDQTDFRSLSPKEDDSSCEFCSKKTSQEVIIENDFAFATKDGYPVTEGHTLILPKRHVSDFFDLSENERSAINDLLQIRRKQLLEKDREIKGFNVGVNCGSVAGQTIFHSHVHLIPRRPGDTPNPRGGVRGVIPEKMNY